MGARWRLLVDGPGSGAWNMGVDEALLASARREGVATLRLYRWDGPWLSLGYGQDPAEAPLAACRAAGVGVVRRVTGGRAVLHGRDLTYGVAAPEGALPPGRDASYGRISEALLRALRSLGIRAERVPRGAGVDWHHPFDCFAAPAAEEIEAGGRKLAGSAQRRGGGAVLQHGSIRLTPDPPVALRAAGLFPATGTSLEELGFAPDPDALTDAVVAAFANVLEAALEAGTLDPTEREWVARRLALWDRDPLARPAR